MYSKTKTPPISVHNMYSLFLWWIDQDSSSKGGGGVDCFALAKLAHKAWSSVSTSNKICPCATWTVITISSKLRIEESLDEEGGGLTAAVGSIYSLAVLLPERGGLDASPVEDSSLGCLELAFI